MVRRHVYDLRSGLDDSHRQSSRAGRLGVASNIQILPQEDACDDSSRASTRAPVFRSAEQSSCVEHRACACLHATSSGSAEKALTADQLL
jgi:hypothetical protein